MAAPEDRGVGRHPIALGQDDEVVAHELAARDADAAPLADHERARAREVPERLERPLRLSLLHERQAHDEDHEAEQHHRFLAVAEGQVDPAAHQQQERHGLPQEADHAREDGAPLAARQLVEPIVPLALEHVGRSEAGERVCRVLPGRVHWNESAWCKNQVRRFSRCSLPEMTQTMRESAT